MGFSREWRPTKRVAPHKESGTPQREWRPTKRVAPHKESGAPQRPGGGIETPIIINDKVKLFFSYVVNVFTTLFS